MTGKTVKDGGAVRTPAVVRKSEGADYVLVAGSDGHAHMKTVQVGVRNAEFAQIVTGVAAGDPVISSGGYALPDNTQVKVEAPAPPEKEADDKSGKTEKSDARAKPANKDKEYARMDRQPDSARVSQPSAKPE